MNINQQHQTYANIIGLSAESLPRHALLSAGVRLMPLAGKPENDAERE